MTPTAQSGAATEDPAAPRILIMSGNEAIARGAWEAGVRFASAYPGTPSTEILESLRRYEDVYAEWAPNEKVAMEAATGASMAGARSLVCMKHVGLNVAADPFFSASNVGVKGGMVVVSADDPAMHSSQDEQDSRFYADFALVPCLEPTNQQEAYEMTREAFDLSERFQVPVMIRITTRLAHSRAGVRARAESPREVHRQGGLDPVARQRPQALRQALRHTERARSLVDRIPVEQRGQPGVLWQGGFRGDHRWPRPQLL